MEKRVSTILCVAAAASSFAVAGFAQDKSASMVDPRAVAALDKMGAYLRSLTAFEVMSSTMNDEIIEDNLKVKLAGNTKLQVRRPDRLRAEITTDRKNRQIFYDGKSATLYGPRVKYYATVAAPPTIQGPIEVLAKKYGIEIPLADLFYWGTNNAAKENIKAAYYLGPATVDGAPTDHYVFRQQGVDWQVWIEKSATPLPRKIVITNTSESTQPEYIATLTWNINPSLAETNFSFHPPEGAMRIAIQTADGKVDSTSK